MIIVDVPQLLYHIVWPHGGTCSDLVASIQGRLGHYPISTKKIVVFDKYHDVSTKDHEHMRSAGDTVIDYELSISNPLPKLDIILKTRVTNVSWLAF